MSLARGTRIGAYEIVSALGAGGMGEVYRAHDPRLGRDVALKVLPADMGADPSRLERFTREARAIAALNHPHIVTIYSTEEADGVRFLTMELVEGQPLDALIPASGMPLARFLELAVPLADALSSYKLVAVATAGGDKFGMGSSSIRTVQDLTIYSGVPPLLRSGDFYGATFTLRNGSDRPMTVTANVELQPAVARGGAMTVTIPPGGFCFIAAPVGGWTVDGSHKNLMIANSGGFTSVTYDIVLVGTSA